MATVSASRVRVLRVKPKRAIPKKVMARATGTVITTTAALFAQIYVAHGEAIPVLDLFRSTTVGGVVATVLLLITRGVPPRDLLGPQLLVLLVLAIPSPVFGWLFWAFPVWGARLVDPDFKRG